MASLLRGLFLFCIVLRQRLLCHLDRSACSEEISQLRPGRSAEAASSSCTFVGMTESLVASGEPQVLRLRCAPVMMTILGFVPGQSLFFWR